MPESGDPEPPTTTLSRRHFLRLSTGLTALGAIGLSGCAGRSSVPTLAVGLDQDVPTLDPAMHRSRTVEAVIRNLSDGLVTRDADMRIVPEISESWRRVDDLTWEFVIRSGIRFHNGDALTAEDAAFTIQRTITPEAIGGQSSPRKGLLGSVDGAEAADERTLRITTAEPYPLLPKMLAFHEIVPKRYIEQVGDEEFGRRPVGAGPFRFVQHVAGERIVMERFPDYHAGAPPVERLVFLPIPEVATRLGALLAGEIDIAEKVPPHAAEMIDRDSGTRLSRATGTRSFFIGLNCRTAPLDDVRVRRALAHGLDIPRIVDRILSGHATALAGPLTPAAFGFDDDLAPRQHDPSIAKSLLTEAGIDPSLELELDCEDVNRELAEAAAAQLSELGISVRPRVWKWDVLQPLLKAGERQMWITSWGNASLDPAGILPPLFVTGARGNFMGYSNTEVDAALERSQMAFDSAERKALFIKVQRVVHDEVPAVFGWATEEIYGVSTRVGNWEARPDAMLMMHRASLA